MINHLRAANWGYVRGRISEHLYRGYAIATPLMGAMSLIFIAQLLLPDDPYFHQFSDNIAMKHWWFSMEKQYHLYLVLILLIARMTGSIAGFVGLDAEDDDLVASYISTGLSPVLIIINLQTGLFIEYTLAVVTIMWMSAAIETVVNLADLRIRTWKGRRHSA